MDDGYGDLIFTKRQRAIGWSLAVVFGALVLAIWVGIISGTG
jgi:hypothetical protein